MQPPIQARTPARRKPDRGGSNLLSPPSESSYSQTYGAAQLFTILLLALLLLPFALPMHLDAQPIPLQSVNVFTGTSNSRWMLYPGAARPLGLVKFSPDNQASVWNGGYEYTIGSIAGFSLLHAMGLNGFSMMPVSGPLENEPGQWKLFSGPADGPFGGMWTSGYRSRIDKKTETGSPGYYAVTLVDAHTRVELTATERTGWLRYLPAPGKAAHLLFDFDVEPEETSQLLELEVHRDGDRALAGFMRQRNQYAGEYTVFFRTEFSIPIASMNAWRNGAPKTAETSYGTNWRRDRAVTRNTAELHLQQQSGGVWVDFASPAETPVVVRSGVSLVGASQAAENLAGEAAAFGFDFEQVRRAAEQSWAAILDRVQVKGGTGGARSRLYTGIYRSYAGKSIIDDVDGSYRDACGAVQKLPASTKHVYSSDGLWGVQWTMGPLWTLLTPDTMTSFNRALLLDAERGGWLPQALVNNRYSPIMDAQHQVALLTGAWQKGERSFDAGQAYAAIRKVLTEPGQPMTCGGSFPQGRTGNVHGKAYLQLGYVPEEDGPASSTFEYAYDDACAATLATALGKTADAELFSRRAANWRNGLSPDIWATRRSSTGALVGPDDLQRFGTTGGWTGPGFMEGTPWIYTWFVPQDVPALIKLMGVDRFNARLQEGFEKHWVDLTNEPNLQAPWLFNYSGRPSLAQFWAHDAFVNTFDDSPLNGWPGEEDEGQMGSYVALLGMGLFDMEGGCRTVPSYQITTPEFAEVSIKVSGGVFTIGTVNFGGQNRYIQSASLNGVQLRRLEVAHADVVKGGHLELVLGPQPNDAAFVPSGLATPASGPR